MISMMLGGLNTKVPNTKFECTSFMCPPLNEGSLNQNFGVYNICLKEGGKRVF
jgi:hypothetical protein